MATHPTQTLTITTLPMVLSSRPWHRRMTGMATRTPLLSQITPSITIAPRTPPPNTDLDMQLDDPHSTSTSPANNPPNKSTRFNARRNYRELGVESSSEHEQADAPAKHKKSKKPKSQTNPRGSTTGDLKSAVHQSRPLPIIYGTHYMKIEVIDMTEIEVNSPKCPRLVV